MIEIKKADFKKDLNILAFMERIIFPVDYVNKNELKSYSETYILFVKKKPVGYVAVKPHAGLHFGGKYHKHERKKGALHIVSTGILPEFRNYGLASILKAWTVAYARLGKFKSVNTTARISNKPIISLNKKFGFKITRKIKNFYNESNGETAVVQELVL